MAIPLVDLWTDGSGTAKGPGGWAYVLSFVHPLTGEAHELEGVGDAPDTTNNRMEMTALLMGLRALKRPSIVVVHTDSEYVMKPFTEGWLESRWEKKQFHKIKNVDLWLELRDEVRRHIVSFEWVRGHSGVTLNERCDKLAGRMRRQLIDSQVLSTEVAKT